MIIGKLLPWVYTLDFTDMTILLIICSILFCSIHKRFLQSRVWKLIVAVLLIATFAGILYITLGTRTNGEIGQIRLIPLHSYREVINGGNPEILRSNFMNTVLFYPIGLLATALLPERWCGVSRCVITILLCVALSTGIEYVQYICVLGQCEIDDVIHNTIGALAGSLTMLLMPSLMDSLSEKSKLMWIQRN